jgi:hypothetical protein
MASGGTSGRWRIDGTRHHGFSQTNVWVYCLYAEMLYRSRTLRVAIHCNGSIFQYSSTSQGGVHRVRPARIAEANYRLPSKKPSPVVRTRKMRCSLRSRQRLSFRQGLHLPSNPCLKRAPW